MGTQRRIDSDRAERLLDGTDDGSDAVARLLDAARASAPPDELRGEDVALAAFRTAEGASPAPQRPVRLRRGSLWANALGIKAAVAAFTLLASGVPYAALVAAAQGADRVQAFCADLLASPGGAPGPATTEPGTPDNSGSGNGDPQH